MNNNLLGIKIQIVLQHVLIKIKARNLLAQHKS